MPALYPGLLARVNQIGLTVITMITQKDAQDDHDLLGPVALWF
jgi:hypothetical protein